jgi:crotonobetainyl-CoA:carnitine CoA-transferase CaiB-like acyl-CoA transferase
MVFRDACGYRHAGPRIRFRNAPPQPDPALPSCGEPSAGIAAEAGLGRAEIEAFRSRGVI